jgi:predicted dithiol-disulfide oxidoreductase (DUF899 family)
MSMKAKIVSPSEWHSARVALLAKEKQLTQLHDELAKERRELPWVRVDNDYVFDGPDGKRTLAELFDGKSQLAVWHFMMGPGWKEGCPSCSMLADHVDGTLAHLAARDVAFCAISRAPYAEIVPFKTRMGWRFPWLSSFDTTFNRDFHVAYTKEQIAAGQFDYNYGSGKYPMEEAPGISVFAKDDAGAVYHTYSSFARGAESLLGVYTILDMMPKGRDESGLPWPMAWVRHHDRYGKTTTNA